MRSKLFAGPAIMIAIASLAACDDDENDNPVDGVDDTIESIVDDVTDDSEQPPTS